MPGYFSILVKLFFEQGGWLVEGEHKKFNEVEIFKYETGTGLTSERIG